MAITTLSGLINGNPGTVPISASNVDSRRPTAPGVVAVESNTPSAPASNPRAKGFARLPFGVQSAPPGHNEPIPVDPCPGPYSVWRTPIHRGCTRSRSSTTGRPTQNPGDANLVTVCILFIMGIKLPVGINTGNAYLVVGKFQCRRRERWWYHKSTPAIYG